MVSISQINTATTSLINDYFTIPSLLKVGTPKFLTVHKHQQAHVCVCVCVYIYIYIYAKVLRNFQFFDISNFPFATTKGTLTTINKVK